MPRNCTGSVVRSVKHPPITQDAVTGAADVDGLADGVEGPAEGEAGGGEAPAVGVGGTGTAGTEPVCAGVVPGRAVTDGGTVAGGGAVTVGGAVGAAVGGAVGGTVVGAVAGGVAVTVGGAVAGGGAVAVGGATGGDAGGTPPEGGAPEGALGGGRTGAAVAGPSAVPLVPAGRSNGVPVVGSTNVNWLITLTVWMTVIEVAENDDHEVPTKFTFWIDAGVVNGLPQKHLVTGLPDLSTSTAVPACSTAGMVVALPLTKPWLVTTVSVRNTTEVRVLTKVGIWVVEMPSTPAQAFALSGWACRKVTIACGSQVATLSVPPNRPGAFP